MALAMKGMQQCRSLMVNHMNDLGETRVVIIGASGFGRECLDVLEAMISADERIEIVGILDDSPADVNLARLKERDISYLGTVDNYLKSASPEIQFLVGIGNPQIRESIAEKLEVAGLHAFTAVHPSSIIGSQVKINYGAVVCAGAIISTNVLIGRHVHLNPGVIVGHDSILEDFVSVNPGAVISGDVKISSGALIGASALVLQQLSVGSDSTIGAGAVVTKNVPSEVIVKGIPGRWHEV